TFESRELVKFVVASLFLAPPAFVAGALLSTSFDVVARASAVAARAVGRAASLALATSVAGSLGAGFVLLARLGSLAALDTLATLALVAGAAPLVIVRGPERRRLAVAVFATIVLFAARPKAFDYGALAS